jgi:hypothetical protein
LNLKQVCENKKAFLFLSISLSLFWPTVEAGLACFSLSLPLIAAHTFGPGQGPLASLPLLFISRWQKPSSASPWPSRRGPCPSRRLLSLSLGPALWLAWSKWRGPLTSLHSPLFSHCTAGPARQPATSFFLVEPEVPRPPSPPPSLHRVMRAIKEAIKGAINLP